jgi:hypothetical protein
MGLIPLMLRGVAGQVNYAFSHAFPLAEATAGGSWVYLKRLGRH